MQLRTHTNFSQGEENLLESSFASSAENKHVYLTRYHANRPHTPSAARWKATLLRGLSGMSRWSGEMN